MKMEKWTPNRNLCQIFFSESAPSTSSIGSLIYSLLLSILCVISCTGVCLPRFSFAFLHPLSVYRKAYFCTHVVLVDFYHCPLFSQVAAISILKFLHINNASSSYPPLNPSLEFPNIPQNIFHLPPEFCLFLITEISTIGQGCQKKKYNIPCKVKWKINKRFFCPNIIGDIVNTKNTFIIFLRFSMKWK